MFLNPPPAKKIQSSKEMHVKKNMDLVLSVSLLMAAQGITKLLVCMYCSPSMPNPKSHPETPRFSTWLVRGGSLVSGGNLPRWVRSPEVSLWWKKWKCRRLAEHFFGSTNLKVFCVFWCGKSRNQEEKGGKETIWKWNCWVSKQVYKANQMESSHRWWPWNPSDRTRHFKKFWKSVLSFNGSNLPTALFVFQETGSAMGLLEAPRPSFQNWPTGLQCWQKTMTTTDRQCGRQVIWLDPKQKPIQFTFLHHANSARCWIQYQI